MFDILKDLKKGWLPMKEIPMFVIWMVGELFWFFFGMIVMGMGMTLVWLIWGVR